MAAPDTMAALDATIAIEDVREETSRRLHTVAHLAATPPTPWLEDGSGAVTAVLSPEDAQLGPPLVSADQVVPNLAVTHSAPAINTPSFSAPSAPSGPRSDAPVCYALKRGRMPDFGTFDMDEALQQLDRDVYATTSWGPRLSRIKFVERVLRGWGLGLNPLTVAAVKCLGAVLKAGGYRSAAQYLSVAKVEAERMADAQKAEFACC